ncbi:hypothetical protein PUN28_013758 [Cardiocondyla obscurior]|uniref:Uncharacterized protein n=1 Tax=Cardiocondyla obscurior TaxID=286306 RepID=A0AAW2F5Z9_9HYME
MCARSRTYGMRARSDIHVYTVEGGPCSLPFITLSRIVKYLAFHISGSFPYRINGRPTGLIDR